MSKRSRRFFVFAGLEVSLPLADEIVDVRRAVVGCDSRRGINALDYGVGDGRGIVDRAWAVAVVAIPAATVTKITIANVRSITKIGKSPGERDSGQYQ